MAKTGFFRLACDADLRERLAALRMTTPGELAPAAVEEIVGRVVSSLSGDLTLADLQLYREVEALAAYIQNARREIAALRTDEIREQHIPTATDQLDAVVEATAEATGIILGQMEELEALARPLPPATAARIAHVAVKVYEACSFQDITGQRIAKVVQALHQIEGKIDALLDIFGAPKGEGVAADAADAAATLLNGPQLPTLANSQADIDAILASLD